jgi:rfaE bifunctional protein nucleotidyltransferase chain/domain
MNSPQDGLKTLDAKIFSETNTFLPQLLIWRSEKKRIVFTNGCFDLLHAGHVAYLEEARALGDVLILGLNTDASVKLQEKDPHRPIQDQITRARVLAALSAVDAVVFFNGLTPESLIRVVRPDVLVKGGDWSPDRIAGGLFVTEYGGIVLSLPFLPGNSTTDIIQRILDRYGKR